MDAELDAVKDELNDLRDRVARLEAAAHNPSQTQTSSLIPGQNADTFWALNTLASQRGNEPATHDGIVMLVGSLTLPDGTPVSWQEGAATGGLLETDWSTQATALAALGHPVRLELLRRILEGAHTTAELSEATELGTSGQLHHHLRQLLNAGWVRQSARGVYEVPAARVVPLLACIIGGQR